MPLYRSRKCVIWNDNMTSPRILANISSGGTSRGDVAHVRMFDESSYFTIEKSSSGKDTTLRTSNDSCCHHIRAPYEISSSQSYTRLIPLLLSSRGFHKTISSLMLFGTDKNVSDIVRVISFRDLNRPTIVRDSVIDFGTTQGAARNSVARFNSRFGSDVTFLATRRSDKSLVSSLHFSSDVLSLIIPSWYREVESDGKRERLVMDLRSSGISYECLTEYLYCAFVQTRNRESLSKYTWIPKEQSVSLEDIELIQDMWNLLEIPVQTHGTIRIDSFRR